MARRTNVEIHNCPCGDERCSKVVLSPFFNNPDASLSREDAEKIVDAFKAAARWDWVLKNKYKSRGLQYMETGKFTEYVDKQIEIERQAAASLGTDHG